MMIHETEEIISNLETVLFILERLKRENIRMVRSALKLVFEIEDKLNLINYY